MMPAVKKPTQRRTATPTWLVPAVVAAVVAVLLAVTLTTGDSSEGAEDNDAAPSATAAGDDPSADEQAGEQQAGEEQAAARALERHDPDDPLTAGPMDAPITMVVFSDYQCPFCAAWSHETLPEMREYVEAGDLRIEWRDVNIMSDVSEVAAAGAYAAGLQDRFWDYHELLFPDGDIRSASELTDDGLVELAAELGLDQERFADDMSASGTIDAVDHNAAEGLAAGVYSTPSFIIDGQPILGAQPTQVFIELIEQALADGD